MGLFKYFKIIFKTSPTLFLINFISTIVLAIIETAAVVALAPIIDYIVNSGQASSSITRKISEVLLYFGVTPDLKSFTVVFILLMTLKSVSILAYRFISLKIKYHFLRNLMTGTLDEFMKGGMSFVNSEKQGVLLSTFQTEIVTVGNSLTTMSLFLSNIIQILFYFAVPFSISWQLSLISIALFAIVVLPSKLLDRVSYRKGLKNVRTSNHLGVALQEALSSLKVILAFGNREKSSQFYQDAFDDHRKATISFQMIGHFIMAIFEPLLIIVLFVILYLAQTSFKVVLSEVIVMLFTFKTAVPLIVAILKDKNNIVGFMPSYEHIQHLIEGAKAQQKPEGHHVYGGMKSSIEFKNVSFSYHSQLVLNGISLTIRKGEKIAFVGKSGAGKTTVVDLLLGLYSPTSGDILVDGRPLAEFKLDSFRRRIGYVPQDPVLFNRSLRDNLHWATEGQDSDQVLSATLKDANAQDFVTKMINGLDTQLGERGTKLSGGERQRIALARALVRKPDILILDEATSALDNNSERLIQEAVDRLGQDITVITIAHRLSTIKKADRIFYIEEGKVLESGSYDELMLKRGKFMSLSQAYEQQT